LPDITTSQSERFPSNQGALCSPNASKLYSDAPDASTTIKLNPHPQKSGETDLKKDVIPSLTEEDFAPINKRPATIPYWLSTAAFPIFRLSIVEWPFVLYQCLFSGLKLVPVPVY
jgi:hypothetical protein